MFQTYMQTYHSIHVHRVSEKMRQLILCFMLVKYEPISIKIGRHVLQGTINKKVLKCPLYLKYVLALPWEI